MVLDKGIEPFLSPCKREVLPLNQSSTKMVGTVGFEPTISCFKDRELKPDLPTYQLKKLIWSRHQESNPRLLSTKQG